MQSSKLYHIGRTANTRKSLIQMAASLKVTSHMAKIIHCHKQGNVMQMCARFKVYFQD